MKLLRLTPANRNQYLTQILDLEREATYPYGESFFKIDHGKDYFAFFERLGALYYYVLLDKDRIAGIVAAVLISTPAYTGLKKIWYYCDLKIHPDYRGQHLPIKMAYQIYLRNFLICRSGFGISMNPALGSEHNQIKKLSRWLKWIPLKTDIQISLFSLEQAVMQKAQPILEHHRGKISFLSLAGIKDLILIHDQSRIPILHTQFGNFEKISDVQCEPQKDHIHMFCAVSEDSLVKELALIQIIPSSTFTLFNYGKKIRNWDWILTSDL